MKKTAYHHGDLKDALVEAAREIIERDGVARFTLREGARRAGVSHGAPAHHFGDKTGLLTELAARAFDERRALGARYVAEAPADPAAQLKALGLAYIDFAVASPGLHDLICSADLLDWKSPRLREAAAAADAELVAAMSRVTGEAMRPGGAANLATLLAWSVVHGFAALVNERKILADVPRSQRARAAHELADQVLSLMNAPAAFRGGT